ncbi:PilT protein domain protein [Candidatus Jidaibacter acanthamoeba]|uniref:PilT protein domain protein n=2 Tax=Candidatus Jidaibacter acanthamoebae TaxID=86105 RepID=A0A0C1MSY6_9RICK|nr:PilT protein domain protein [Candidatus Jidaibacter acanthamoeba]
MTLLRRIMIGIDTDILVRYLTQDNTEQANLVSSLLEKYEGQKQSIYINKIVLCELILVLEKGYKYSKSQITLAIRSLLSTQEFMFEHLEASWLALEVYEKNNANFSDALIGEINRLKGCSTTYTLDIAASELNSFRALNT